MFKITLGQLLFLMYCTYEHVYKDYDVYEKRLIDRYGINFKNRLVNQNDIDIYNVIFSTNKEKEYIYKIDTGAVEFKLQLVIINNGQYVKNLLIIISDTYISLNLCEKSDSSNVILSTTIDNETDEVSIIIKPKSIGKFISDLYVGFADRYRKFQSSGTKNILMGSLKRNNQTKLLMSIAETVRIMRIR